MIRTGPTDVSLRGNEVSRDCCCCSVVVVVVDPNADAVVVTVAPLCVSGVTLANLVVVLKIVVLPDPAEVITAKLLEPLRKDCDVDC